jgi:hypothetical protein
MFVLSNRGSWNGRKSKTQFALDASGNYKVKIKIKIKMKNIL